VVGLPIAIFSGSVPPSRSSRIKDMAEIGTDISKSCALLKAGQLVAIPTETVYGLAANALDLTAVGTIFEAKSRPTFDPLIVHIGGLKDLPRYSSDIPAPLLRLAEAFWPGPLTLLLPKADCIPDMVTSGLPRVGIRVPDHALTLKLLAHLDLPLAAPSANPFGYISPTTPAHVEAQLGNKIPYILDGGPCGVGIESTIVGMEDEQVVIYRLGGLALAEIEAEVGRVVLRQNNNSNPRAPGQLDSHYAPRTPLMIGDLKELVPKHLARGDSIAILSLGTYFEDIPASVQQQLSPSGDIVEAAANLFAAMRTLDGCGADLILAEFVPEQGLGWAINDRLKRAAS